MYKQKSLSVLIPVYNEAKSIISILDKVITVPIQKEIIIVDDFSNDGTREILKKNFQEGDSEIKVIYHAKNMGKGSAIKTALSNATGDYAIIQDADLEYDPLDYIFLIEAAQKINAEAVFGSRFLKTWRATSFLHFLVNKILTEITNILYGCNLTDMETCYKMIKTDVFKSLEIKSKRFEIEAEITAKLAKRKFCITEVPISYKGRSYHEGKKITWKDGMVTLFVLLKYRFCK